MSLKRVALAAATVLLLVAGCSRLVDGSGVTAAPRPGAPVNWAQCNLPASDVRIPVGAECSMLSVPVDYAKPDGDLAQIAMIRFKATGPKIGSLIINPGGPGKSGVNAAASLVGYIPETIRQRFDLVGFDPRGVGASTPAITCNSDADTDKTRADPTAAYTPEGVAHLESMTKDFVARCVDKTGKDFLANVGTLSVAKDLDAIREAVGDEKLTYLGYSYGTVIGAAYAEQFPDKIRAMILDGAVDPNADPIEATIRQSAAFQTAFNDYAADCAKNGDCPLGDDPAKAVEVYHDLVYPLVERPAVTKDPRGLGYSDSVIGTILPLYAPRLWTNLTQGLAELRQGRGDTLLALADQYMGRDRDGHYDNFADAISAINCVDEPPITDRAKVVEQDRRLREVAPFMSYGDFTGYAPLSACAFWPVPATSQPHALSVKDLPPTLVVSTTNDPATPYQAGVDLAKQVGGSLLTFEGTQHTVMFQGSACVDDIGSKYLIDLTLPPPDSRC